MIDANHGPVAYSNSLTKVIEELQKDNELLKMQIAQEAKVNHMLLLRLKEQTSSKY
jgi:hypothetical protein